METKVSHKLFKVVMETEVSHQKSEIVFVKAQILSL